MTEKNKLMKSKSQNSLNNILLKKQFQNKISH
jgi:hypothetical protein